MEPKKRWIVVVLIVLLALVLSACAGGSAAPPKVEPVSVEEIPGSELKRVVITEKAAERLGIQTATVREEQVVQKQTVLGVVVAGGVGAAADGNQLWVHTPFSETDFKLVARDQPAVILPVTGRAEEASDEDESGWTAELDEALGLDDGEDSDEEEEAKTDLYYAVDGSQTGLVAGERVLVEVALSGNGMAQLAIPYDALIYDTDGRTWVYVKEPNALAFVRESVTVDHIRGDLVFLVEGPSAGAEVVTVGGSELYGAETGVSK